MSYPQNYTITQAAHREAALQQAYKWVAEDKKNRSWSNVGNTGSMRDKFDENAILLLTKCDGSDIKKGDLVYYSGNPRFAPGTNAIHEVAELNDSHFIANGTSNRHYDGWSPRAGIKFKANVVKYPKPTAK